MVVVLALKFPLKMAGSQKFFITKNRVEGRFVYRINYYSAVLANVTITINKKRLTDIF
jgi:hypothetical protein